jgi:hypothetical protein
MSIGKSKCSLKQLERDELAKLILRLRRDLFMADPSIPSSMDITDNDDDGNETQKEENQNESFQKLIEQSNTHGIILHRIADQLEAGAVVPQEQLSCDPFHSGFKVLFGVILLWTLIELVQKQ